MKRLILSPLFASALFAQGTLSLSNPAAAPVGGYPPGTTVTLNITKTGNLPAAFQFDIAGALPVFSMAPIGTAAAKTITCSTAAPLRCIVIGNANANTIPDGVIVTADVKLASTPVTVTMTAPVEADASGGGLVVTVPSMPVTLPIRNMCDVNGDGVVNSVDTLQVVSAVIAKTTSASTDTNSDGATDVRDAQIVATAAAGGTCNAH